ncbi:hypothetical protein [Streptomyces sp. H27-D2]|uniref:hypothetical protein n=1 Tax=Streptomyces sp. H27-D2 TaxID=3046304 RepID=UPI002DBCA6C5|nr:hypothetical protein [Streptomyces sp. H27-D2]MEC4016502.1 hypothetical protein [Streptomyces sp. H27-D2]
MARHPLPAATALIASAALLLSACGGSDEKPNDDEKIVGAEHGDKRSASPADPSSAGEDPNASKRPELKTDKDFKTVFEGWTSKDPKKKAVLLDAKYQVLSVDSAIFKQDPQAPEVAFYNSGPALASAKDWVSGFKKNHHSSTGTARYYEPRIKFLAKDYATLAYCSDESRSFSKNLDTGKKYVTTPSAGDYTLYSTGVQRNSDGIWKTTSLSPQEGKCQP